MCLGRGKEVFAYCNVDNGSGWFIGGFIVKGYNFYLGWEKNYFRKLIFLLCIFILFFCCWIDVKMLLKKFNIIYVYFCYMYIVMYIEFLVLVFKYLMF